jgi:hypothetical protein
VSERTDGSVGPTVWIATEESGISYWFLDEPELTDGFWLSREGIGTPMGWNIVPPGDCKRFRLVEVTEAAS